MHEELSVPTNSVGEESWWGQRGKCGLRVKGTAQLTVEVQEDGSSVARSPHFSKEIRNLEFYVKYSEFLMLAKILFKHSTFQTNHLWRALSRLVPLQVYLTYWYILDTSRGVPHYNMHTLACIWKRFEMMSSHRRKIRKGWQCFLNNIFTDSSTRGLAFLGPQWQSLGKEGGCQTWMQRARSSRNKITEKCRETCWFTRGCPTLK